MSINRKYILTALLILSMAFYYWKRSPTNPAIRWIAEIEPSNPAAYMNSDEEIVDLHLNIARPVDLYFLSNCKRLKSLMIESECKVNVESLRSLKDLEVIKVAAPKIVGLGKLEGLPKLDRLSLMCLEFDSLPKTLPENLKSFSLEVGMQAGKLDLGVLASADSLDDLSIGCNSEQIVFPASLHVRSLHITIPSFNKIILPQNSLVEHLFVSCFRLDPAEEIIDLAQIAKFTNLRTLRMSGWNAAEIRNVKDMAQCSKLELLVLKNKTSKNPRFPFDDLDDMVSLKMLEIEGFKFIGNHRIHLSRLRSLVLRGEVDSVLQFAECPLENLVIRSETFTDCDEIALFENLKYVDVRQDRK